MKKCPKCGSGKIIRGNVSGAGRFGFYFKLKKFLCWEPSHAKVYALACVECGYIEQYADKETLSDLLSKNLLEIEQT